MNRLCIPMEVKGRDDSERTFEGLSAAYSVDLGKDRIHPGAFKRTLDHWRQSGRVIPLLDQHAAMKNPVHSVTQHTLGKMLEAEERDTGLWTRFKVAATKAGDDLLALLRDGMVEGLSIGYDAVNPEHAGGIRHLKEIKLGEVSVVTFGMNPDALIIPGSVKSLDELTALLREGTLTPEQKAELRALLSESDPPAEGTPAGKGLAPDDPQRIAIEERLRAITLRSLAV